MIVDWGEDYWIFKNKTRDGFNLVTMKTAVNMPTVRKIFTMWSSVYIYLYHMQNRVCFSILKLIGMAFDFMNHNLKILLSLYRSMNVLELATFP